VKKRTPKKDINKIQSGINPSQGVCRVNFEFDTSD
jgi:hypothetical protein